MIDRILIAYDGSPGARTAVETAGRLFPSARAMVLYARQPLEGLAAHLEGHPALEDIRRLDASTLDSSQLIATEGVKLAEANGLRAEPEVSSTMETAATAIAQAADEVEADVIIIGNRRRGGVAAALLGSTSAGVVHQSARPVLVVPVVA